jgi:hypothetical protein
MTEPKEPTMADAAEMLWIVLANVSGGDWTQQTLEWREAAARWRDNYFAVVKLDVSRPVSEGPRHDDQCEAEQPVLPVTGYTACGCSARAEAVSEGPRRQQQTSAEAQAQERAGFWTLDIQRKGTSWQQRACEAIEQAIASDDGLDGLDGERLLQEVGYWPKRAVSEGLGPHS